MDKSEESPGEFIIAGSYPSEALKLLKETLDEMALLVLPPVARPRVFGVCLGRDTVLGMPLVDKAADRTCPIGLVAHDDASFQRYVRKHLCGDGAVIHVAGRELDVDGVPQRIDHRVDLGAPSASAHADLLVLGTSYVPFFAPALA